MACCHMYGVAASCKTHTTFCSTVHCKPAKCSENAFTTNLLFGAGGASGMSPYVWFCGIIQYLNLVGTGIGYTVTAGISMT